LSRELVIAALSAAAGAGIFLATGPTWLLLPYAGFLLLTAAVGITDIDAMRIVDRLNLRGSAIAIIILGAVAVLGGGVEDFPRSLGGGVAYFLGALLLFIIGRGNGFGAGDVKLAPLLGVFTTYLGWVVLGRAVVATAFIGGLLAVGALLFSEAKRDTELPYGPAMILGAWLAIFLFGISAI
jgi:leader peptidase (prepilin peptidase)/N-methyltransferase